MKPVKRYPNRRAMSAAEEEGALVLALQTAELRILLGVLTPEQLAEVAPKLRAIYAEFSG